MITGTLRNQIDKLWTEFWTGGITNPLTVIEQISFLMFSRLLDIAETRAEKRASRLGKPFKGQFSAKEQKLRWSHFKNLPAEQMLKIIRDDVFPHFRNLGDGDSTFAEYMTDAQLMIQKPSLLVSAVNMIDALPLTEGDTKGDLYEYLLGKLTTAGINGQFRTPRHIIRLMVDLIEPKPTEIVGDPACGTAGFLVAVMQHLLENYTSPEGVITHEDGQKTYTGDLLEPYRKHIQTQLFHGYDFDTTMLRIAAMNLMLHGVESPDIHYQDTLSNSFPEKYPKRATDGFDVILANPPFKGSLDESDVHSSITGKVKTKKTELLFVALILRMLKLGGRAACIVPDGVLFGSSSAHRQLRKLLVEDNQLEAVISMPAGVFKPYADVSTAILFFTKGGLTTDVWFYEMRNDGFALTDTRTPIEENDIPDIQAKWPSRLNGANSFRVSKSEIAGKDYSLLFSRYKAFAFNELPATSPSDLLQSLEKMQGEIDRSFARFLTPAKSHLADVLTQFRCDWVQLGEHIEEVSENMGELSEDEFGQYDHLRGVSNEHGIIAPPFDRVRLLKNPRRYVVLRMGYFAYNPMRINVGSIGLVRNVFQQGKISPDYVVFKTKPTLPAEFLFQFLKSSLGSKLIQNATFGAVRKRLYFKDMARLRIPLPSPKDLSDIAQALSLLENTRHKYLEAANTSQSLLSAIFSVQSPSENNGKHETSETPKRRKARK